MTDSNRLNEIIDSLPKGFPIKDFPDIPGPTTLLEWAVALGHPMDDKGRCPTCGTGVMCELLSFCEAMVSSVVRELDKLYTVRQRPPAAHLCICGDSARSGGTCPSSRQSSGCPREGESGKTFRERCMERHREWLKTAEDLPDEEPDLNHEDTRDRLGPSPSYRCYVSRHGDCEVEKGQAEEGCTCACHPGAREKNCGVLGDHDPHGECWGNGPFRKVPEDARSPYRRREWTDNA